MEPSEYERLLFERDTKIQEMENRLTQSQATERRLTLDHIRRSDLSMALNQLSHRIRLDAQEDVKAAFSQFVKVDPQTEKPYVVDAAGAVVEDPTTGDPLSVAAAMGRWLQTRPHFLRTGEVETGASDALPVPPAPTADDGNTLKVVNGKKPVLQANGKLLFRRSDLRRPNGSVDTEFMDAYRDEIRAAQREGRVLDDIRK